MADTMKGVQKAVLIIQQDWEEEDFRQAKIIGKPVINADGDYVFKVEIL